jgi:hypothetical protein
MTEKFAGCSLSIMVARTDIPFIMHTIPHLVRTCNYPFVERVLMIDTAPLSGDKLLRPGIGSIEQLRECCDKLLQQGIVDQVVDIDYSPEYRDKIYQKHFGGRVRPTHNYKGYPIWGTIYKIEQAKGDYMLHFDSDMLLYQKSGYSWIEEAIQILQQNPDVISVRPLSGPPNSDKSLHQNHPYELDASGGFYQFKFFSSRAYLIDRHRFNKLLPLDILWRSARNPLMNLFPSKLQTPLYYYFRKGKLDSWEIMVSQKLEKTSYIRATMSSPNSWTIHPVKRGDDFIQSLPILISKIEDGYYPLDQAGHYDLRWEAWQDELLAELKS